MPRKRKVKSPKRYLSRFYNANNKSEPPIIYLGHIHEKMVFSKLSSQYRRRD